MKIILSLPLLFFGFSCKSVKSFDEHNLKAELTFSDCREFDVSTRQGDALSTSKKILFLIEQSLSVSNDGRFTDQALESQKILSLRNSNLPIPETIDTNEQTHEFEKFPLVIFELLKKDFKGFNEIDSLLIHQHFLDLLGNYAAIAIRLSAVQEILQVSHFAKTISSINNGISYGLDILVNNRHSPSIRSIDAEEAKKLYMAAIFVSGLQKVLGTSTNIFDNTLLKKTVLSQFQLNNLSSLREQLLVKESPKNTKLYEIAFERLNQAFSQTESEIKQQLLAASFKAMFLGYGFDNFEKTDNAISKLVIGDFDLLQKQHIKEYY